MTNHHIERSHTGSKSHEPHHAPGALARARHWLLALFADHAKTIIGGSIILPATAALLWGGWALLDAHLKRYILKTTVEELAREKSELFDTFKSTLQAMRKSEAGAVSVGSFVLTPGNRAYTVYVYFPEGYTGKIFYRLRGKIVPQRRYVVLAANSKAIPLDRAEDSIILEKYFRRAGGGQAEVLDDIFEKGTVMKTIRENLRAVTFQLTGADTYEATTAPEAAGCAAVTQPDGLATMPECAVEISYVSLVGPAIHIGQ